MARTPAHEVLEGKTAPADEQFLAVPPADQAAVPPGDYRLVMALYDADGNQLSENVQEIRFVAPMLADPGPF